MVTPIQVRTNTPGPALGARPGAVQPQTDPAIAGKKSASTVNPSGSSPKIADARSNASDDQVSQPKEPSGKTTQEPSDIQAYLQKEAARALSFSIDGELGLIVTQLVDTTSHKTLWQIPSAERLAMVHRLHDEGGKGAVIDQQA